MFSTEFIATNYNNKVKLLIHSPCFELTNASSTTKFGEKIKISLFVSSQFIINSVEVFSSTESF